MTGDFVQPEPQATFAELSPPYATIVVDPPWHYDKVNPDVPAGFRDSRGGRSGAHRSPRSCRIPHRPGFCFWREPQTGCGRPTVSDFTTKRAIDLEPGDCVNRVGVVEAVEHHGFEDVIRYVCLSPDGFRHTLITASEAPVPVSYEVRFDALGGQ